MAAISRAIAVPVQRPKVIILKTVKGHGVSFMQDAMEWHYLPLTESQYNQALEEVSR
jgi:transketolase